MYEGQNKHRIASLAHAKAHEVEALRELRATIGPETTTADVIATVGRMIDERQQQVAGFGSQVAGHA